MFVCVCMMSCLFSRALFSIVCGYAEVQIRFSFLRVKKNLICTSCDVLIFSLGCNITDSLQSTHFIQLVVEYYEIQSMN
jgi:hypothetical protein